MVFYGDFKTQLDVTVSGPRGIIKKISEQNISRSIDLSEATPGNVVIDNAPGSIKFPRGIETLRVNPTQIVILIDRLTDKVVPIDPVSKGKLPSEFEIDTITIEPRTLALSGPQEIIKDITSLKTHPIDLSGITHSSVKQVSLDLLPEVANLIGESIVAATITIKDKMISKKIRKLPITIKGLTENKKTKLSQSTITIKANIPKILVKETAELSSLFEPFINAASLPDGTHELPVEANTSSRITIEEISPEKVKLTLKTLEPLPAQE